MLSSSFQQLSEINFASHWKFITSLLAQAEPQAGLELDGTGT